MPTIDRDGVAIHYDEYGSKKDVAGMPFLLTHGYAATGMMWRPQIEAFGSDHHLITWDMRGHGRSDSPEDEALYSRELTVEDMRAILDALEIEQAVITGHSLGGYMSLAFHAKYPQRTGALILQGTGPGYRNPNARQEWNESRLARASRLESEGLSSHDGGAEVDVAEHRSADGLVRAARGMLTQHDSWVIDTLDSVTVPVLLLVGEQDIPFRNGIDYMDNKIRDTEKHIFSGAGHGVNIEDAAGVNTAISGFLGRILGTTK